MKIEYWIWNGSWAQVDHDTYYAFDGDKEITGANRLGSIGFNILNGNLSELAGRNFVGFEDDMPLIY
jgi:hypothetical protein